MLTLLSETKVESGRSQLSTDFHETPEKNGLYLCTSFNHMHTISDAEPNDLIYTIKKRLRRDSRNFQIFRQFMAAGAGEH